MMTTILLILAVFVVGGCLGVYGGLKIASKHYLWRVRMHFYAQGMNHKGVDKGVHDVFRNPGFPDPDSYKRIKRLRKAEGLDT